MKIFRDLDNLPVFKNAVITIGSFDGVHLGHQKILQQINTLAKEINGETVLITFYPHPRFIVSNDNAQLKLLSTLAEKADLLDKYGVDNLVVVPFSKSFAAQQPEAYIRDFLVNRFHPAVIAIGYDHKFGQNRKGDFNYLQQYADELGYRLVEISKREVADVAVSSTKVRNAVLKGDVAKAANLLGHPYSIEGKVIYGQQIGTKIGFPTANIEVAEQSKLIPPHGIYAVKVFINNRTYKGMLYIGNRPTIDKDLNQSIEVNIFDFDDDIYGCQIKTEFIDFVRPDKTMDSLEMLRNYLQKDKEAVLKILS